jgi:hypothetical protein
LNEYLQRWKPGHCFAGPGRPRRADQSISVFE